MNKISIVMVLVMATTTTASALSVNSVKVVSATSQFEVVQNITCDLACQEAIINEADNDDIVDRMMEECGLINQY
jgi:hypothetical protein